MPSLSIMECLDKSHEHLSFCYIKSQGKFLLYKTAKASFYYIKQPRQNYYDPCRFLLLSSVFSKKHYSFYIIRGVLNWWVMCCWVSVFLPCCCLMFTFVCWVFFFYHVFLFFPLFCRGWLLFLWCSMSSFF